AAGLDVEPLTLGVGGDQDADPARPDGLDELLACDPHTCRLLVGGFFAAEPPRRLSAPTAAAGNHCSIRPFAITSLRSGAGAGPGDHRGGGPARASRRLPRRSWPRPRPPSRRCGRDGSAAARRRAT